MYITVFICVVRPNELEVHLLGMINFMIHVVPELSQKTTSDRYTPTEDAFHDTQWGILEYLFIMFAGINGHMSVLNQSGYSSRTGRACVQITTSFLVIQLSLFCR